MHNELYCKCVLYRLQFEDEIRDDLKHTGAGVLSMANRWVGVFFMDALMR